MTIEELTKMTNDEIQFGKSADGLLIRSRVFKYADFIAQDAVEAIEMFSESKVRISVPKGTKMGDKEIVADLETGAVIADGKVFDEEMPDYAGRPKTSNKTDMRFTPTINGFSIGSVKMMPSEDGYACYCKVYFKGKKIGDFVDKGDGSEYSFYADKPYCSGKVEKVVRSFPSIVRDYGMGAMEVEYCIGVMVDDLMEMKDSAKQIKKLGPMGKDYVRIDDWKKGLHLSASIPSSIGDEEMSESMRKNLSVRGMIEYEIKRYRSLDELHLVNTFVTGEMLR